MSGAILKAAKIQLKPVPGVSLEAFESSSCVINQASYLKPIIFLIGHLFKTDQSVIVNSGQWLFMRFS